MSFNQHLVKAINSYYRDNLEEVFNQIMGDNFTEESLQAYLSLEELDGGPDHLIIPTIYVVYKHKGVPIRISFCIKEYEHDGRFDLNIEMNYYMWTNKLILSEWVSLVNWPKNFTTTYRIVLEQKIKDFLGTAQEEDNKDAPKKYLEEIKRLRNSLSEIESICCGFCGTNERKLEKIAHVAKTTTI